MEENQEKKQGKSKIGIYIVIAIIAIVLIIIGLLIIILNNKPLTETQEPGANQQTSNVQINSATDMENLINTVYEGQEAVLPGTLMTQTIDVSDVNVLTSFTGLTSNENIDAVVVSEPMISSQAYSFVLVKVKDGADANAIAKEMSEKVDTRKWICVEAEKLYATSVDNLAVLIMASDEWATPVYNRLLEVLGTHGEEYVKESTEWTPEDQGIIDDTGIVDTQGLSNETGLVENGIVANDVNAINDNSVSYNSDNQVNGNNSGVVSEQNTMD